MNLGRILIGAGAVAAMAACASSPKAAPAAGARAMASIDARSGSTLAGTATLSEMGGGVHVVVDVTGAPPGLHAVHLHEKGDCSAPDATSAGGHFNPSGMPHGAPDAPEHHAGDFGNMTVGADGHGHLEIHSTMLTVAAGPNSVAGRSIVVHAKEDDMTTQSPPGNAGSRIGCGVVR
jgi:Cu-Zn family superoxide dismutase